ncbi:UDP-arabinose 4-epimerase [Deinobacterium chartae]|uniref:UDP-glucose 4-epimerase n=1 Tax=Deinobacterium chartae TaxID=521158 RepID=A0A841HW38_9DEIO|nr:UDP-glucose 4-epimerase GalE [Deinobacterium chartae]MBB6097607.1 UDP-arabinose 4-epimerase [Deinobacterium chartae]
MKILVTGGAGYIGSHACKALAAAGYTPVTFDNLEYGHEWATQWGPFEHGDLQDPERLREVLQIHRPAAVMHFAAYTYVGESVQEPGKYYRNNVGGTLNLLEAMRETGVKIMVFSSTCATYGPPERLPLTEDHPQRPISPYGRTKLVVEGMLGDFEAACGLRWAALRYFNASGADPEGQIGEDHDPETHLIPLILDAAAGLRPAITVFGEDYDTPDGTAIRDYIHVTDLADAHVLALKRLLEGGPSAAYNLGNGQGFSVREVIQAAERVTGRPIPVEVGPRRAGDPPRLVGDATKARNELGWTPRYADLEVILQTAWNWHTRHRKPTSEVTPS